MSNVLFGHPHKADDQQDELEHADNKLGVGHRYLPICMYVCVCVCALRVQFNPVTRTTLIQMNSTLCANLKVSARDATFSSILFILYKFSVLLFVERNFQLSLSLFWMPKKSVSNGKKIWRNFVCKVNQERFNLSRENTWISRSGVTIQDCRDCKQSTL